MPSLDTTLAWPTYDPSVKDPRGVPNVDVLSIRTRVAEFGRTPDNSENVFGVVFPCSVSKYIEAVLRGFLQAAGLPAIGIPRSELVEPGTQTDDENPVSKYVLRAVATWCYANEIDPGQNLTCVIPMPANALCKLVNLDNGVVGHCVVPVDVRSWLAKFHAGEFPELLSPA